MIERSAGPPHWHNNSAVSAIMTETCLALLPGIVCYVWFFGWGIAAQCLLAAAFALLFEAAALRLRRRDPRPFLRDGSAVATGLLFALCVSPLLSWWASLASVAFAILIAKHVFGGLGRNLFNPAMAGCVFALLCFPEQMNAWPPLAPGAAVLGPGEQLGQLFSALSGAGPAADSLSGATPLNAMKARLGAMDTMSEIEAAPMFGNLGGAGWEWVNLSFLLGGLWLLFRGIIRWHIPAAVLAGVFLTSSLFYLYDADLHASPLFHLCAGGTLLCAFFVATDPVTAATTNRGRLIYGGLIGVLLCLIRAWGTFPDGAAFAVLIANAFAPLIDVLARPRVFGEQR